MVYTVGHSTRAAGELVALLREHGVRLVLDVRRFPGSRRFPQFGADALAAALGAAGIAYRHEPDLGGRRRPAADSPNTFWRSAQFRGYADHLAGAAARAALERVAADGAAGAVALLCAEAVPWRCHRQLIADTLVARGIEVRHILGPGRAAPHELNRAARLESDGRLVYPAPA